MSKNREHKSSLHQNKNCAYNISNCNDIFSFFTLDNYTDFFIEKEKTNHVLFILNGKVKLSTTNSEDKVLEKETMFLISNTDSTIKGTVLERTVIVILNIGNSITFYKDYSSKEIKSYCLENIIKFEALEIRQPILCFLEGIIIYFKYNVHDKQMYQLKKYEFLYLIQAYYEKKETIRFFSPIINNMGEFRKTVFSRYTKTCNVEQLASMCNMTTKTFTRRFKEQFNTTPYQWLMEQKNRFIKTSLAQGVPIQEIADEFGFASTTSLIRYCKKNLY
ncbi:transcriptional regulator, AraC family [Bacteroides luti]|uniref:Transcriptional regulator, AraC family n=1 Tax=Bacteroides luti TaxID=1297750 RepID=A0A1M4U7G8_9BACE|nr:helix-turn-helix domain-containing protein [Bacteroides luti]SHE52548.1 transcriptional regulator, AraC family [Bacteroides luti]